MASHSFSHPSLGRRAELGRARASAMGLRIPGYQYNAAREITGARDYINTLAPPGKRPVVLWSGDTQPLETQCAWPTRPGLLNMNSGNTWISPRRSRWSGRWA